MTLEQMTVLADLMRGRELTSKALALRLVQLHGELEGARRELKRLQKVARREPGKRSRLIELENKLESKNKALQFAIQRQEVLRQQLARALEGKASRPAFTLSKKEAE